MLDAVSNKVDFPKMEKDVLSFWEQDEIFKKSLEQRVGCEEFLFYDGPPFATGMPHYGHLLAGTIKDIVPRYQTMRGKYVERRFGWDCHGLPVEYEMEQELNISGKKDIEALGVDVFNEKCRSIVLRYTEEWRQVVTRMGRWVDFDNDYKTMDAHYMESIWWMFKSLWEKQLIYEGQKILPYCPRCATPLSNFETNQGYKDVQDPAITIRFKIEGEENSYILAWTTTPWTLPSNLALAVGPDIEYVKLRDGNDTYIMAASRVGAYYKKEDDYELIGQMTGMDLEGLRYEPLFPYFAHLARDGAFRVGTAEFVSTEDGTGIVHVAPGFGEDDYLLGQDLALPVVCPVDDSGCFTAEITDFAGRYVKETDSDIIARLKAEHKLVHRGTINHSYPHCWRCDSPLIYRGISTWFVHVERIKEQLLKNNDQIHWVPGHLKHGRFGKWLENARDWAISRNRYWGTPLPIWTNEDHSETVCVGSLEELEALSGHKVTDLHKHFVDNITIPAPSGNGVLTRISEVLDCWFESGSMPYAQSHYPFENKERFEACFPADFIAEGLDQTRGWFYTLMVLSTAVFDKPAFKNVVVNGLILAEDGRKMSKRLKNYPDPSYLIETYGADALRLYMIYSPVVRAEDLCFSEEGVKHALRHFLIPWWNAYSFLVTYARIDQWTPDKKVPADALSLMDRWIMSSLDDLVAEVGDAMDHYDLQRALRPFIQFIEDLTNWYIRRSRRRFWKSSNDADKLAAYQTLYTVLLELCKVAAPFVPFISDAIYQNLRTADMEASVHLCDFPQSSGVMKNDALNAQMKTVMAVVGMGRQLRSEHTLKVRQPLAAIHVVCRDADVMGQVKDLEAIIMDELNVKRVIFSHDELELVTFSAKPHFKILGPKLGPKVKMAGRIIGKLTQDDLIALVNGEGVDVVIDELPVTLTSEDVVIERLPKAHLAVASEGSLVVALETELTPELVEEGLARELVNKIQTMRKNADFDVVQRIAVWISGAPQIARAVEIHAGYVKNETLTLELNMAEDIDGEAWDINGYPCVIKVAVL